MPISKVGAIVPDDDSDTEGFAPRDIIETDADIQRHAEVSAGADIHSLQRVASSLPECQGC